LASLIEALTYSGFLVKHFNLLVGVVLLFLTIILFLIIKKIDEAKTFKNAVAVMTVLVTAIYLSMNILENATYPNYVFSHFHLHPELLFLPIISVTLFYMLNENKKRNHFLFYGIIILILGQYVIKDFNIIKNSRPFFILRNINLSYDEKMELTVGKISYDFTMFVKNNTSEDSTILIPPQGYPWPQTGNVAYLRYFLYPRKLISGNERDPGGNIKNVDYVLIDYGETNISEHGYTNIWPKFDINGDYIIHWNPLDGTTLKENIGVYTFQSSKNTEEWGLIRVKK
jgi:hypothetical protein